ncbi:hypothetical protein CTI12_AA292430 [Artemisia annua]|uniref:Uncharacterized protein n=1 Tax=Artemisia annua TaxID=35608 RepID=A0A2U1N978_ARTAN|nr:hypothetical protein CTI12_AA292430 [Artemisia annua]
MTVAQKKSMNKMCGLTAQCFPAMAEDDGVFRVVFSGHMAEYDGDFLWFFATWWSIATDIVVAGYLNRKNVKKTLLDGELERRKRE